MFCSQCPSNSVSFSTEQIKCPPLLQNRASRVRRPQALSPEQHTGAPATRELSAGEVPAHLTFPWGSGVSGMRSGRSGALRGAAVVLGPGAVPPGCPRGGQTCGASRVQGGDGTSPARESRARPCASRRDQHVPQAQGRLRAMAPTPPPQDGPYRRSAGMIAKGTSALRPTRDTPTKPQCSGGFASDGGPHPRFHASISL